MSRGPLVLLSNSCPAGRARGRLGAPSVGDAAVDDRACIDHVIDKFASRIRQIRADRGRELQARIQLRLDDRAR